MDSQMFVHRRLRAAADLGVTSLFVVPEALARCIIERWQKIERDIGGLIV
jgi:hypothetical protein